MKQQCVSCVAFLCKGIITVFSPFHQKNIEIENAEEAHFLKNKLCDLLKDFKNKKSAKVVVCVTLHRVSFLPEHVVLFSASLQSRINELIRKHVLVAIAK